MHDDERLLSRIREGDGESFGVLYDRTRGFLLSCVILPAAYVDTPDLAIVFLLLSCVAFGVYTSNHWAITQTLAGPLPSNSGLTVPVRAVD